MKHGGGSLKCACSDHLLYAFLKNILEILPGVYKPMNTTVYSLFLRKLLLFSPYNFVTYSNLSSNIMCFLPVRSSSSMKLKKQVRLSEVWISANLWDVSERRHSADDSFVIGWPTTNYVVTFR